MTTDTAKRIAELLPCPFCGGRAEIIRYGNRRESTMYTCTDCSCSLETGEEFNHGARWNTRATPDKGELVPASADAQPSPSSTAPEPVAWLRDAQPDNDDEALFVCNKVDDGAFPVYTAPPLPDREAIAALLTKWIPSAFSVTASGAKADGSCGALWPDEFGEDEQLGFRKLAAAILKLIGEK